MYVELNLVLQYEVILTLKPYLPPVVFSFCPHLLVCSDPALYHFWQNEVTAAQLHV